LAVGFAAQTFWGSIHSSPDAMVGTRRKGIVRSERGRGMDGWMDRGGEIKAEVFNS